MQISRHRCITVCPHFYIY